MGAPPPSSAACGRPPLAPSARPLLLLPLLISARNLGLEARLKKKTLEEKKVKLFVDRIQGEQRAVAGYLAGPIIREKSTELIADMLIKLPIFIANNVKQLEIFEDSIRTNRGSPKKFTKRTKAMHIFANDNQKDLVRKCLASIYPSSIGEDYPMGIRFRFIPNTVDPDFAVPPAMKSIALKLKAKQASFLNSSITHQSKHLKDIFAQHEYDPNKSF